MILFPQLLMTVLEGENVPGWVCIVCQLKKGLTSVLVKTISGGEDSGRGQREEGLVCSICLFPWCKYFYYISSYQ